MTQARIYTYIHIVNGDSFEKAGQGREATLQSCPRGPQYWRISPQLLGQEADVHIPTRQFTTGDPRKISSKLSKKRE